MTASIEIFLCRTDNIGALIHDPETGATAAIDAPDAAAIQQTLETKGLRLTDILITHHHADHIAGIDALKQQWRCRVIAPALEAHRIAGVDVGVREGDRIRIGSLEGNVIATPGHTLGHVAYWFEADKALFAGDTLFSLGCGRLFEGSPADMWASLVKLRALPDDTSLYCGHDYTLANARFALSIDPHNAALAARAREAERQKVQGRLTLPSVLGDEKRANPFLRADSPDIAAAVGLSEAEPIAVFKELRQRKDRG